MYLSKIEFSPAYPEEMVNILAKGIFSEHQMIWNLFEEDKSIKRDFLYRRDDSQSLPFYYLLSAREPVQNDVRFHIQTQAYNPHLKKGDELHFSLRANAVKTITAKTNAKKIRRRDIVEYKVDEYKKTSATERPASSVIRYEAGKEWLEQQGKRCGFEIRHLMVENHQYYQFKKPGDRNQRQFTSLDFLGQIKIIEPEKFIRQVLFNGLGRAKAYGCGLFLVRRI